MSLMHEDVRHEFACNHKLGTPRLVSTCFQGISRWYRKLACAAQADVADVRQPLLQALCSPNTTLHTNAFQGPVGIRGWMVPTEPIAWLAITLFDCIGKCSTGFIARVAKLARTCAGTLAEACSN